MTNNYFAKPSDLAPATKARSADINAISQAIDAAFQKVPDEGMLKTGTLTYAQNTGNAANAYLVALDPKVTSLGYVDGLQVTLLPMIANTGASTLNVNSLGNIAIKRPDGTPAQAGDLLAGAPTTLIYSVSANAFLLPPLANAQMAAASNSATAAANSATAAAQSASNAAGSASTASNAATAAGTYASNASGAASAASGSATAASTSAGQAAASASSSATSATTSGNSATAASGSATAAANSATAANTSAGNAATSATAAASSATAASTSATNASNSAGAAAGSATAAANSATNAAGSATAAANSVAALHLADYAALRTFAGTDTSVYVTGYLAAAQPSGIAGMFVRDDSDTSTADNAGTVIVASNGKRWKRAQIDLVKPGWFGAKADGVADDTGPIQAAMDYAAANGKTVLLPDGTCLLGTLTYLDPTGIPGDRIWGLLFARSNLTVRGNGNTSVLKVAGGLVASNYTQAGTKGFQVFVHTDPTVAINNFAVSDFAIDFNGANNLVYPANSYGNQSTCHGVMIQKGDRISVERLYFHDHPGHQVIALSYGTTNCIVRGNEFSNCGWMNGTNANLTDHSSIYCGGDGYVIESNKFRNPALPPFGTAIEMHGTGIARGNRVNSYALPFISSALVRNAVQVFSHNYVDNALSGFQLYCQNNYTLRTDIFANVIDMTAAAVSNTSPVYQYRNGIYAGQANIGYSPGAVDVTAKDNKFRMIGARGWSTDAEDLYNSFMVSQLVSSLMLDNNIVQGFRGPLLTLERQASGATAIITKNKFLSCGRRDDYIDNNALVNYTNAADNSYGVPIAKLTFGRNLFSGCSYANYLSMTGIAAGAIVYPTAMQVVDDTHDRWLSLMSQTGSNDIGTSGAFEFRYKVTTTPDTTKPFPTTTNAAKYTWGIVDAQDSVGWPCKFYSVRAITDWKFEGYSYGGAPTSPRPFGDKLGDRRYELAGSANAYAAYYCTVASANATTVGTWKGTSLNQA